VKFFCHFGLEAFSNAYLVGPDEGGEAVLIDPGEFDETLLAMIEKNRLDLKHILLTHAHESHMRGVPTALKIYDATVYGVVPLPRVERHRTIEDGEELELGRFRVRVLWTPGHSPDSVVYHMPPYLFTGDTLHAGALGSTSGAAARQLLLKSIRREILSLDDETIIFPGHGPPSKVGVERALNPDLREDEEDALAGLDAP
jgi:glyoxylase-like metal-dependent hydrolase (beta-lactamase superfamily II)